MSCSMTKPTKWLVHLAKTLISLCICAVWSESSLCAQWVATDPRFLHGDSEDSDLWSDWADAQADLSLRWVHRSFCLFCHAAAHKTVLRTWFYLLEKTNIKYVQMFNRPFPGRNYSGYLHEIHSFAHCGHFLFCHFRRCYSKYLQNKR